MRKNIDDKKIIDWYTKKELSLRQIAAKIGVDRNTIRSRLIENNISIRSCTHYNENLIGKTFGSLVVLEEGKRSRHIGSTERTWLCKCECGNIRCYKTYELNKKRVVSCGCIKKINCGNKNVNWKGFGEIGIRFFNAIKYGAVSRNLEFDITIEYIWELYLKQKKKCALTGIEISFPKSVKDQKFATASLDRIDSIKGYTKDNVQWVHKKINLMKQHLPEKEFFDLCEKVIEYRRENL